MADRHAYLPNPRSNAQCHFLSDFCGPFHPQSILISYLKRYTNTRREKNDSMGISHCYKYLPFFNIRTVGKVKRGS